MPIKSGTLRRKYNEAIKERIVCRNALLMSIMYMVREANYSAEDKILLAQIMLTRGYSPEYMRVIMTQITKEYFPTSDQVLQLISLVRSEKYTYDDGYIDDSLMRSVDYTELRSGIPEQLKKPEEPKRKTWNSQYVDTAALKRYIFENDLIVKVLESIGCRDIMIRHNGEYYTCSNYYGNNEKAILVNRNPYIGVTNWTRQNEFDDNADIITLVEYNMGVGFRDAIDYLQTLLGIKKGDLSKFKNAEDWGYYADNEQNEAVQSSYDESQLLQYRSEIPWRWREDGIVSLETYQKFEIKTNYDPENGIDQIIIPIRHYESGELLALNRRNYYVKSQPIDLMYYYGEPPKYRITAGYKKGLNLYGLYQNRDFILRSGYVVVYEAEKSVLKRDCVGDSTGVALQGHSMSEVQAKILLDLDVDIVISMDKDVPIDEIRLMCSKMLYRRNRRNLYYTIDNHGLLGEKDSIADHPGEVSDRIFAEKVLYDVKEHQAYLDECPEKRVPYEKYLEPLRIKD